LGSKKFDAGTFDVGLVKAWSEACKYLSNIGMDAVQESDRRIWTYAKERLEGDIFSIVPGGNEDSSMVSFVVNSMHPHDVAEISSSHNFEIRTGHMCAQGALENLGFKSLCRLSWGIGSDASDIEAFIHLIEEECQNGK
jgi:cysteine desulfurase/selenocysteine lyase